MAKVKEITTLDEWHAHVGSLPSSTLLVVHFHAPWAQPCVQMAAVIKALAEENEKSDTSWVSINAEELSDISETYNVVAVPYVVLQRNSIVVETISGSNPLTVRKAVEKHASPGTGAPTDTEPTADTSETISTENGEQNGAVDEEDINKRLAGLVNAAPVMLFMKGTPSAPQCGFSRQMVAILRERSVKYGFFNILADDDVRQGLKKFGDWPTYPQLWVSGELLGGLDIVKTEIEDNPDFLKEYSVAKEEGAAAA